MSRPSLAAEIAAYLDEHGPSTTKAIAAGIRARRVHVAEALLAGSFQRAERPEGAHPSTEHWTTTPVVSRRVPSSLTPTSRAGLMLSVLRDGRKHSRREIFEATGSYFLTNNAASELRKHGYDVRKEYDGRNVVVYWLEHAATAALRTPKVASLSGPARQVAA